MIKILFENIEELSAVAIREFDKNVSYSQLIERIAKRAHSLKKQMEKNSKIAVYLPRSIEQIVSTLAIFESGLTYVPIDVDVAQDRVEYIIKEANCKSIITTQELYNALNENIRYTTSLLNVKNIDSEKINDYDEFNTIDYDTDAYIIFTSGTTGNPKGVRISYSNLYNLIKSSYEYFKSGKKHETILLNSLSFDFSIWEIIIALSSGDCINILEDAVRLDQKKLIEAISEKKIDSLSITPSYMASLLNVLDMYKIQIKNIITRIILGAEKVSPRLIKDIFEYCGSEVEIYNAYGPTEVTVCSFIKKINIDEMERYNRLMSVPIGVPFQGVKAIVENIDDNEPIKKGELILCGCAVSDRGYIRASEEEKKKFEEVAGERVYHTGDIVLIDNNEFVFVGRNDSQCKINGFRVELDEIRNLILNYTKVSDAYVTTYDVSEFTTVIIAFVVGKSSYKEHHLREICESKLNKYMRPNYYIEVNEFPRTNSGKIDSKMLIEIFKNNYLKTENKRDGNETFYKILTEILGVEKIDSDKSFFELGGGSLNAIQLQNRLAKEFNCEIKVKDIFESKSLKELSEIINGRNVQDEISDLIKVSFFQEQMWIIQNMMPDSGDYNVYYAFEIEDKIDTQRLYKSLQQVHEKNDILQSIFVEEDGNVYAKLTNKDVNFRFIKDYYGTKEQIVNEIKEQTEKPFDLKKDILYSVSLYNLKDSSSIIFIKFHHILVDEIGIRNYYQKVKNEYLGASYNDSASYYELINSEEKDLDDKKIELYSRKFLNDDYTVKWRKLVLKGNSITINENHIYKYSFLEQDYVKLIKYMEETHYRVFSILLAAFTKAIFECSVNKEIAVGIPVSNRSINSNECIGPFINTVPVLIRDTDNIQRYMEQIKDEYYSFIENREVPLHLILQKLKRSSKRDMVKSLFNILFAEISNSSGIKDDQIKEIELLPSKSKFDLALYYEVSDGKLSLVIDYDSKIFKKETIGDFVKLMEKYLQSLMNHNTVFEETPISSQYYAITSESNSVKETDVLEILSKLLNNNDISISDNFFEIGGDSIIAIKLISELKKQGYIVKVSDLFDNPNVNEFVSKLEKSSVNEVEIIDNYTCSYQLTDAQKGILWECLNSTVESQLYHQQFDIKLSYDLDPVILQNIVDELVDKIPVLKNAILFDDKMNPIQESIAGRRIIVEHIYDKDVEEVLELDKSIKFDFQNSPLIRIYYAKVSESNSSHLIISYHHILLDGWSIIYIIEQLFDNYQRAIQGEKILVNYNNFFKQIVEKDANNVVEPKIIKYWEEEIKKIVPVENIQKSSSSKLKSIFIEEEIADSIKEYAKTNRVTVNSVFLAAYVKALIGESGEKTLGITLSGREDISEEMMAVGCLIRTLPINMNLQQETVFKELVQKCHDKIAELYLYGKYTLSEIKKKMMENTRGHIELFDDVYAFQNYTNLADLYEKYNIISIDSTAKINYGRTLVVTLGKDVEMGMMYGQQYRSEEIELFLKEMKEILVTEILSSTINQFTNTLTIVRGVWKEILNNDQISDTDNFFELGGDSITSLRVSLKLRDYGIFVPADSLFHYQSINELVDFIKSADTTQEANK